MRRFVVAFALTLRAAVAFGQTESVQQPRSSPDTSLRAWATLALGLGAANGNTRLAGDIAAWFTRGRVAVWVRDAATTRAFEAGDLWDLSVLAGVHPPSDAHLDFVAGAGLGLSRGHGTGGENLPSQPALALGAQLMWSYRVIGIGFDGFATMSSGGRQYYGVGLALGLGAFRAH